MKFSIPILITIIPTVACANITVDSIFKKYISVVQQLSQKYGDKAIMDANKHDNDFLYGMMDICNDISYYIKQNNLNVIINSENTDFIKPGNEYDCTKRNCQMPDDTVLLTVVNLGCLNQLRENPHSVIETQSQPTHQSNENTQDAARNFQIIVDQDSAYWNKVIEPTGLKYKIPRTTECEKIREKYKCVDSATFTNGTAYAACGFVRFNNPDNLSGSKITTLTTYKNPNRTMGVSDFDNMCNSK